MNVEQTKEFLVIEKDPVFVLDDHDVMIKVMMMIMMVMMMTMITMIMMVIIRQRRLW